MHVECEILSTLSCLAKQKYGQPYMSEHACNNTNNRDGLSVGWPTTAINLRSVPGGQGHGCRSTGFVQVWPEGKSFYNRALYACAPTPRFFKSPF